MDIGVFIPINNNGWIISATSPQYMPSFELNRQVVQKAEAFGLDFALSMIKLHGFGGETEFWDHGLESFTLMAGLAAVTSRIRLYASVAVLTIPPAIVARMTSTISDISNGRFGVNIVSGWHKIEYSQMGLWPGDDYFGHRYDYSTEYARILRELWETGQSDMKGTFFQMDDCKLSPRPAQPIKMVAAGQSDRGMEFAAQYCDFNFAFGEGVNTPTKGAAVPARMLEHGPQDRPRCRHLHALHDHRRRNRLGGHGKMGPLQRGGRQGRDRPFARQGRGRYRAFRHIDGFGHSTFALADQFQHGHTRRLLCRSRSHAG
jgi:pyrimidine oxygenase